MLNLGADCKPNIFSHNLSANRSRRLKIHSNGLRTVIWVRRRHLLLWCFWRFIRLPKALLLLCFLKRHRASRPLLHGRQRSPWQRYICRNCDIIIIFCTFPCAFVILISWTCLPRAGGGVRGFEMRYWVLIGLMSIPAVTRALVSPSWRRPRLIWICVGACFGAV